MTLSFLSDKIYHFRIQVCILQLWVAMQELKIWKKLPDNNHRIPDSQYLAGYRIRLDIRYILNKQKSKVEYDFLSTEDSKAEEAVTETIIESNLVWNGQQN